MPLSFLRLVFSSPLPSLVAEIRDQLYCDVFAVVIILLCRPESCVFVYLKLRNTWLPCQPFLWGQDSTLFTLYNLWHFYSSLLGLAQSRENVEEKEKKWIYQCAAVIWWSTKSSSSLFCWKQILFLRTHLLSIFTNSALWC